MLQMTKYNLLRKDHKQKNTIKLIKVKYKIKKFTIGILIRKYTLIKDFCHHR